MVAILPLSVVLLLYFCLVEDYFIFLLALSSVALNFLSLPEVLAISSNIYSFTVFQPDSDLSAIQIGLFRFWIVDFRLSKQSSKRLTGPCFHNSSASPIRSNNSKLNLNWSWFPLYLTKHHLSIFISSIFYWFYCFLPKLWFSILLTFLPKYSFNSAKLTFWLDEFSLFEPFFW